MKYWMNELRAFFTTLPVITYIFLLEGYNWRALGFFLLNKKKFYLLYLPSVLRRYLICFPIIKLLVYIFLVSNYWLFVAFKSTQFSWLTGDVMITQSLCKFLFLIAPSKFLDQSLLKEVPILQRVDWDLNPHPTAYHSSARPAPSLHRECLSPQTRSKPTRLVWPLLKVIAKNITRRVSSLDLTDLPSLRFYVTCKD